MVRNTLATDTFVAQLSPLDETRFGIRSARANISTLEEFEPMMDFCREHEVVFLIVRCPISELRIVQAMERHGFLLMDTLIYYSRDLTKPIPKQDSDILIRPIHSGDEDQVKTIAAESFVNYHGHYHADERLDREKCDEVYISWATRSSTSREVADEVLVAQVADEIVGFLALKMNTPEQGEGTLLGVAPSAQGGGIGGELMIGGLNWFLEHGAKRMIISTQLTNLNSQKVWSRIGFEPSQAFYTLHKWFDEG